MAARSTIVYDIEVAGFPWEEVDEITRGYLVNRQRSDADREAVRDRTALFPGLSGSSGEIEARRPHSACHVVAFVDRPQKLIMS